MGGLLRALDLAGPPGPGGREPASGRLGPGAPGGAPTYKVRFGVILDVNGTSVPITADDLSNAKTNGVEFTLPDPIALGNLTEFESWVSKFGVAFPAKGDLPGLLDTIVGDLTNMNVTVEKAHVKVPGSNTPNASVQVTIEASGTFAPAIDLISGKLGVQGVVFGFSNEDSAS